MEITIGEEKGIEIMLEPSLYRMVPYILGRDQFLPGAREFLDGIPKNDIIMFLTARQSL